MHHYNHQKKSLGFLSVVAFLMILVGVGYTVSSVFAVNTSKTSQTLPTSTTSNDATPPKEGVFASLEKQIATTATSLWNELLGNTSTDEATGSISSQSPEGKGQPSSSSAVAVISLAEPLPFPKVYEDIDTSLYTDAILALYSNGILQGGTQFYPNNYVRISDFIRVVVDTYRLILGYNLNNLEGLTQNVYYTFTTLPVEVIKRINSAYEWGFLTKLALEDADGNSRLDKFISPTEAQEILFAIQKKSPALLHTSFQIPFVSDTTLSKAEMAQLVVSAFGLPLNEQYLPVFSDISGTTYQADIHKLARLGIISGVHGKFYPNAKVENKDFVIMLVRTLIYRQGTPQVIDNFYYLTPLQNVATTATYAPYLEYCLELEICTPLLTQTSGGVTFQANRLLSRSEIVPIVSTAAKNKFDLPNTRRGEYLTRGELAHFLRYMFDIEPSDEKVSTSSLDLTGTLSTEKKSDPPQISGDKRTSRRDTFQELMKIQ